MAFTYLLFFQGQYTEVLLLVSKIEVIVIIIKIMKIYFNLTSTWNIGYYDHS
jgi:hypothetical protein